MRIMIVEDEFEVRELLKSILADQFELAVLENSDGLIDRMREFKPDVVLLDHKLPGKSGPECIRDIRLSREFPKVALMMVTGLSSEHDKVTAFELGADDYIIKPFLPRELVARIRAVNRRIADSGEPDRLLFGDLEIDLLAHRVVLSGQEILLTLTEFNILKELLKRSGQVLSRERLRETALGNLNVTDRTIDVHMAALRKKLNGFSDKIETVRGVGYRLAQLDT